MIEINSKIYIAGATGLIGSAILRRLEAAGYSNLIFKTSAELNLTDQYAVDKFFLEERPEIVLHAAGRVGGIFANDTRRADFIYENLMIEANVIHASHLHGVGKLIFLGSSCIYPKHAVQPIREEELLAGPLEITNEPYAIAKIAGIKLCESYFRQYGRNFFSVMPTNVYGVNDNFDLHTSHVVPALIRKFHEAKVSSSPTTALWGTGTPRREFLYVDDLAAAIVFLMERVDAEEIYRQGVSHLNIGTGEDVEIRTLAETVKEMVGFTGSVEYDAGYPDGTPRKLLDVTRLHKLGWRHSTDLATGLRKTYDWFLRSKWCSETAGENISL